MAKDEVFTMAGEDTGLKRSVVVRKSMRKILSLRRYPEGRWCSEVEEKPSGACRCALKKWHKGKAPPGTRSIPEQCAAKGLTYRIGKRVIEPKGK